MTLPTLPLPASPHGLTYARARLFLGITAVGSAVVLASSLLYAQLPSWGMSTSEVQSVATALLQIGIAFAAVQVAFQIVDLMGGVWLVRRRDGAFRWLARWARGSAVQWMVWMCSAAALLLAARAGGTPAAVAAFVGVQLWLAATRGRMARVITSLPVVPTPERIQQAAAAAGLNPSRVQVVDSPDESFVGGWAGITARTLVVPALWAQLPEAHSILVRRMEIWNRYHLMLESLEAAGLLRRPIVPDGCGHNAHMYYVLISARHDRRAVLQELVARGVHAVSHYVPLHSAPAGRRYARAVGSMSVTDALSEQLIRLPMWIGLTVEMQERVVAELLAVLLRAEPLSQ